MKKIDGKTIGIWILSILLVITNIVSLAKIDNLRNKLNIIEITGQVFADNTYYGAIGALDANDSPAQNVQVALYQIGADGKMKVSGANADSGWNFSNYPGKLVDQVKVDENGIYRFKLTWSPSPVLSGDIVQQSTTTLVYRVEVISLVNGRYSNQMIFGNPINVSKIDRTVTGSTILLTSINDYFPAGKG